ncbi:MAG: hypothetical protein RL070_1469 [Bacteroidota bacterium]|jgi:hypothetical protein
MAAELSMNGKKKIETLQKEFTQKFPYLTIVFLDKGRRAVDISKSLSEVREAKGDDISIVASLKVNTLEKRFLDNYGLIVEVAYQKSDKVVYTKDTVDKTLNELNKWCEANECQPFEFKKSFTGNTLSSVQEQLFESVKEHFPNAEAKKINKDNFLDIYLPEINKKRGTHLFFNTAKDGIKIGFYCRDEEFIASVLKNSSNIEQYAQGIRILNNPLQKNVDEATSSALNFINEIIGEKIEQIPSPTNNTILSNDEDGLNDDNINDFVENYGSDNLNDFLDTYSEIGKIIVLELEKIDFDDNTDELSELVNILGSVNIDNSSSTWKNLAAFIGKEESESIEAEFKDENPVSIVLLYCNGKYVYAFSSPNEDDQELNTDEYNELADIIKEMENADEPMAAADNSTPLLTDISLLITELSKLKETENVDIKLYTNNRSEMTYWLKFELNKSIIEVTRTNWSEDSYWTGKIVNKDLIEGLTNFLENNDGNELVENYLTKDLIDYNFDGCGDNDNGFYYEITDVSPELANIPEEFQDFNGDLNIYELTNNLLPISEELSEETIGNPTHYEIELNGDTYKIEVDYSSNNYIEEGDFDENEEDDNNEDNTTETSIDLNHLYYPKNNLLIEKDYEEISEISDGLIRVKYNDLFGYLNKEGEEIIECKYYFAAPAESNIAFVVEKDENDDMTFHYFDNQGKLKLSLTGYISGKAPNNEAIWVKKEENWQVLDWNGKLLFEGEFDDDGITNFHNGYAWVKIDEAICTINKQGKVNRLGEFEEFKSLENNIYAAKLNDKYAFFNYKGEQLSDFEYDDYEDFEEGFANVNIDGQWGVIDTNCKLIIPCKYDLIQKYSQGVFGAQIDEKYGFINSDNKIVCEFKYDDVMNFSGGYCIVNLDEKYGIIDLNFNEVVPCISEEYPSVNSIKKYASICINEKYQIINLTTGKPITKNSYQSILFDGEWLLAKKNDKWGYVSYDEDIIIDFAFEDAWPFSEEIAKVQINDKFGYIDRKGKLIIDAIYSDADNFTVGTASASKDGNLYGLINKDGTEISQFIYTEISFENDSYFKLSVSNNTEDEENQYEETVTDEIQLNGSSSITLGYNSNTYPTENVCGTVPDVTILEAIGSDAESWSEYNSDNWYEFDNIEHSYGINEPANCALIDNETEYTISIPYDTPDFDRLEYYFNNSKKGDFINAATSYEKCYDFNNWKKYTLKIEDETFYVNNITPIFDNDKVSGYQYESENGDTLDFEENADYSTEGKGLDIELYFNNGSELVPISLIELRDEIASNNIKPNDILAIKKLLMG